MNSNFCFSVPLCIGAHLVSGRLLPLQGRLIVGLIMRLFFVKYEMRLCTYLPLLFCFASFDVSSSPFLLVFLTIGLAILLPFLFSSSSFDISSSPFLLVFLTIVLTILLFLLFYCSLSPPPPPPLPFLLLYFSLALSLPNMHCLATCRLDHNGSVTLTFHDWQRSSFHGGSVSQFIRHTFCPLPVRIHFRPVNRREPSRKRWNLIKTGHTKTQDKESVTSGKKFGQKCSQENEFSLNSKETERIVEFLIQYRLAPSVSKQFTPYLAESLEERGVTEAKPYTAIGPTSGVGPLTPLISRHSGSALINVVCWKVLGAESRLEEVWSVPKW